MKRRMPWMLGTLVLVLVAAAGGGAIMADGPEWVLGPLVTFPVALGAVQLMKLANRRAQKRLAASDFPQMPPGETDSSGSEPAQVPPRLNSAPDG